MESGEVQLAAAVIALAIKDLLHGTLEQKTQVRYDILHGRLDYWIDVVDQCYDVADYIRERLRRLADGVAA